MKSLDQNVAIYLDELIEQFQTSQLVFTCPEIVELNIFESINGVARSTTVELFELSHALIENDAGINVNIEQELERVITPFLNETEAILDSGEIPLAALAIGMDLTASSSFAISATPPAVLPGVAILPTLITTIEAFIEAVVAAAGSNASLALRAAIDALRGFATQLRAMQQLGKAVDRKLLVEIIRAMIRVLRNSRGLGSAASQIIRRALAVVLRQLAGIAIRLFGAAFGATLGTILLGLTIGVVLGKAIGSIPLGNKTVDDYLADCAYDLFFAPSTSCRQALGAMTNARRTYRKLRQSVAAIEDLGLTIGTELKDAYEKAIKQLIEATQEYIDQGCEDNLDIYRREIDRLKKLLED